MTDYAIDLCHGYVRIGECVAGTLDAVIRNLAQGEWRLDGAVVDAQLDDGATLADVDSIRVVRDGIDIMFTGPVRPVASGVGGLRITSAGQGERFILSGPDDWAVLDSRICYPDPASDPPWTTGHDERNGVASTVACDYIAANLGALALADRQLAGLILTDGATGTAGTWSARLQPLGDLIVRICADGSITCRISRRFDGALTVALVTPTDRHLSLILSDQGDLIDVEKITLGASASFVVAGGQGQLAERSFATAGVATGAGRFETFSDQSSLASSAEVQQSATSTLAGSAGGLTVRATVTDDAAIGLTYRVDYDIGDTIGIEVDLVRYSVVVSAVNIHIGPDRAVIRPVLGDATPNLVTGLIRDVAGLQSRFDTNIA